MWLGLHRTSLNQHLVFVGCTCPKTGLYIALEMHAQLDVDQRRIPLRSHAGLGRRIHQQTLSPTLLANCLSEPYNSRCNRVPEVRNAPLTHATTMATDGVAVGATGIQDQRAALCDTVRLISKSLTTRAADVEQPRDANPIPIDTMLHFR